MFILWPRFGARGIDPARYLDACRWTLAAAAAALLFFWARSVAEGNEPEAAAQGLACLALITAVPLTLGSRSRGGIAALASALSAGATGMAVDGTAAGEAAAVALVLHGLCVVRAALARRAGEMAALREALAATDF